jgi:hypothetical protein
VGELALAAPTATGIELLAVVQADAIEKADLRLGSPDGPALSLLELPYTIDRDLEIQR